jgi:hypothetical protein
MRTIRAVLFTLLSLIAGFAYAETTPTGAPTDNGPATTVTEPKAGPSFTVYAGIANDYLYQDFNLLASNHAIAEGGVTTSWKNGNSFDLWCSTGRGGAANECDISFWHNGILGSPFGQLTYQAKVAYYFLSGGGKSYLSSFKDDAVYGHFDIGKDLMFGKIGVGLHSKTELIEGVNDLPFFVVERAGVPLTYRVSDEVKAGLEFAKVWSLRNNSRDPIQATPSIVWSPKPTLAFILKDKLAHTAGDTNHQLQFEVDYTFN